MNEERKRILNLLAQNKITAEDAEALLDAMSPPPATGTTDGGGAIGADPKYLRVLVEDVEDGHAGKVNVRVPFQLIRAGMRLAALLPATAHGPVNKALREHGINIDVSQLKPEDFENLVQHLRDLSVDVEGTRGEKVRVFCE
jgi:SHOCT-like protein